MLFSSVLLFDIHKILLSNFFWCNWYMYVMSIVVSVNNMKAYVTLVTEHIFFWLFTVIFLCWKEIGRTLKGSEKLPSKFCHIQLVALPCAINRRISSLVDTWCMFWHQVSIFLSFFAEPVPDRVTSHSSFLHCTGGVFPTSIFRQQRPGEYKSSVKHHSWSKKQQLEPTY